MLPAYHILEKQFLMSLLFAEFVPKTKVVF